jgi:carbon storage regulator
VLVLTRRANQSIMIGQDIVVTVLEVRGDQVRIGIKAPRDIDVHREEVFDALQLANQSAASPSDDAVRGLEQLASPEAAPVAEGNGSAPAGSQSGKTAAAQRD